MSQVEPLREDDPPSVGPYQLLGRLGAGGQGVVYLGRLPGSEPVAVKVFRDGRADERFTKEIEAARRVEPFCIAQVLDASPGGVRPYIVTEYVEGPSLQQAGRHTGADLQRLAVATATALAAIHQAGIVHRDFKPANVLLGRGGPRVIDFGIARSAEAGPSGASGIMGTPAYMAPEQLAGAPVGPAVDVFAWASVMVFAATGRPPFGEDTLPAVINRILHNEPQLGDLPQPLRTVVLACLAKDPARRPGMRDVLLRLLGDHQRVGQVPHPFQQHPGQAPVPPVQGPSGGVPSHPGYGHDGPPTGPRHGGARHGGARRDGAGPGRTWLVAGVASAVTLVVTGGVAWGVSNVWSEQPPPPASQALAGTTTAKDRTTSPTPTNTRKRTKRTRTPSATPSGERTRPSRQPATTAPPKQEPTAQRTVKPSKTAAASSGGPLRVVSLRAQGARTANTEDCQIGFTNLFGLIEGPKLHTRFTYEWVLDGKVVQRSTAYIADTHTQQVIGPNIDSPGSYRVVLRVTSPNAASRSLSFRTCPVGTE